MSKKSDSYYFQNFIECVQCGCEAAKMLEENLMSFDAGCFIRLNMMRTRKSMR